MKVSVTPIQRVGDRRVRRSRAALMRAAVDLVSERETADIAVSEIAEAADVSRKLLYQHFGDRDALLLAAALDLAERDLLPQVTADPETAAGTDRLTGVVGHFAQHRPFYRAMLNSARSYELTNALNDMLGPLNQQLVDLMSDSGLEPHVVEDMTLFVTGGWAALINRWLMEAANPLDDVEAFSQRLIDIFIVLVGATTRMNPIRSQTSPSPPAGPPPGVGPASEEGQPTKKSRA